MQKVFIAFVVLSAVSGLLEKTYAGGGIEEKLSVQARIWHRFEADRKDFNNSTAFNNYNFLRTQLGFGIRAAEGMSAFVQLQDSRVMGEEQNTLADGSADNFDLHQGFLDVDNLFGAPLDMRLGRMEVKYGEERLLGAVGWHYIGRSFNGARFTVHGESYALDVVGLQEQEERDPGDYQDQFVYGAHLDIELKQNNRTQGFIFVQRRQPRRELNRVTVGAHMKGTVGGFSYESDLAYQFGDITTVANIDDSTEVYTVETVAAYMATVRLGYSAKKVPMSPAVSGAIDYLSGDDDPLDDDYKVFNTLYATNHKFYGFMDYFLNIPRDTYGGGLADLWGRASATVRPGTKLMLDAHYFQAAENVALDEGRVSKKFGTELDLTLKHAYDKSLTFLLGASWFTPGDIFESKRGGDDATWFYIMTIFDT